MGGFKVGAEVCLFDYLRFTTNGGNNKNKIAQSNLDKGGVAILLVYSASNDRSTVVAFKV